MKKKFLFLIMFFLTSFLCGFAQEMRDVVYLKDGSVVKGIIVEQIPNKSIKLQTGDGSLFVYSMDAVEKMTKELREASPRRFAGKGLTAGYKGYVDFGYTLGAGLYAPDRCAVSIVNGVQFNPYLYVGLGVGLNYYTKNYEIGIPVFANVRGYFVKGNVAPFADLRVGYSPLVDATGYYLSPAFGCRFGLAERVGLNVSVGYEMQDATLRFYEHGSLNYYSTFIGGISLKLALDF
jgi:hypothetical protein